MVDCSQALSDPPEPYLAVRLDGRSNRDRSSAMSHSRPESATRCTRATDLAGSHAERMAACACPYCDVPAVMHHG